MQSWTVVRAVQRRPLAAAQGLRAAGCLADRPAAPLPCSVGMMFIPNDDALEAKCKEIFEAVAKAENFKARGTDGEPAVQRQPAAWRGGSKCTCLASSYRTSGCAWPAVQLSSAGSRAPLLAHIVCRWWAGATCLWTPAWWAPSPSRPCPASAR